MTDDEYRERPPENNRVSTSDNADFDVVPTSAADVESAGRSCMAIIVILGLIVVVLALWLALRSIGVGS